MSNLQTPIWTFTQTNFNQFTLVVYNWMLLAQEWRNGLWGYTNNINNNNKDDNYNNNDYNNYIIII